MWRESQLLTWMEKGRKRAHLTSPAAAAADDDEKRHFKEHSQWDNAQIRIIFSGYIIDNLWGKMLERINLQLYVVGKGFPHVLYIFLK